MIDLTYTRACKKSTVELCSELTYLCTLASVQINLADFAAKKKRQWIDSASGLAFKKEDAWI